MTAKQIKYFSLSLTAIIFTACGGGSSDAPVIADKDSDYRPITIIHKGMKYLTVASPYTGKIWLDRNLGATMVCSESRDSGTFTDDIAYVASQKACFGDFYQWGRNADGHQVITSDINNTQATDINSTGSDFIAGYSDWTSADINGSDRHASWRATDGSTVCPAGFRVPTADEIEAETVDASTPVTNRDTAFKNFLMLSSSGAREENGSMYNQGVVGYMWTSSAAESFDAYYLRFDLDEVYVNDYVRARGRSIRCIKD